MLFASCFFDSFLPIDGCILLAPFGECYFFNGAVNAYLRGQCLYARPRTAAEDSMSMACAHRPQQAVGVFLRRTREG